MRGRRGIRAACFSGILLLGIAMVLFFGTQKQGFHEDELYSYYSSNRTAGLFTPDNTWVDTAEITAEFTVLPAERFRYGLVHTVQSWDVHPPLYYDLLHTACSLTPGLFSKWQGIAVNLAAYIAVFFLLFLILRECRLSFRLRALFLLVWAVHPLTVSAAMFIRMYLWLTVWVLACLLLHLRLLRGMTKLRMAGVMAVNFLGFLTHYYYVIWLFFTALTVCVFWFLQKTEDTEATEMSTRLMRILRYGLCHAASLAACVLIYPACLRHILRGYRGQEAVGAFFSVGDWGRRIAFFGGLLNDYLFSGTLPVFLFLFIVLALAGGRRDRRFKLSTILVAVPAGGYFLVVSETALLLGNTSNRYLMPVDPLFLLLFISAGDYLLTRFLSGLKTMGGEPTKKSLFVNRIVRATLRFLYAGLLLFIVARGLFAEDHVLFLYPENRAAVGTARANRDIPAIVLYNEETPDNIWRLYDKLSCFPRLYFVNAAGEEPVPADALPDSEDWYVFAADTADNADRDRRLSELMRLGSGHGTKEFVMRDAMWTWYRLR